MEKWKKIPTINYEISSEGRVRHVKTKRITKVAPKGTGRRNYLCFRARIIAARKRKHFYVHIEVAKAFLPRPNDETRTEVGHRTPNRHDCRVEHLVWVTRKENMRERAIRHAQEERYREEEEREARESKNREKNKEEEEPKYADEVPF